MAFILQRPNGVIAQPEDKPKAIYISTYSITVRRRFRFYSKKQKR